MKRLGFSSQDVCAELCKRWHFSEELVEIILKSGNPLAFEELSISACMVSIAKHISQLKNSDLSEKEQRSIIPFKEWQQIGLDKEDIVKKLPEILALESGLEGLLD